MKIVNLLFALMMIILAGCGKRSALEAEITTEELRQHIEYLASDQLRGRLPGTEGDLLAATYIRDELASYGLKPLIGDGFQEFGIVSTIEPGSGNSLDIKGAEMLLGTDYMPFAFSANSSFEGEVLFAGYGLSIESEELEWDDYRGLDAKGKVVMVLRADPEVDNSNSPFAPFSSDRDKCMLARDKGAVAVLLVSGTAFDQKDEFEPLAREDHSAGIPVFRIRREIADKILEESGVNVESLEKKINDARSTLSIETKVIVSGSSDLAKKMVDTRNVVMLLQGNDPTYSDEYILIGGHFDHLGMGGEGSSSRAIDTVGVHFGADDNASGIASMLEIAEKASREGKNARSIIFAAFAAEEMGLLGSKYLADNLGVEISDVDAMLNLDMVGRMNDEKMVQVGGVGTAEGLAGLVESYSDSSLFTLTLSQEGFGPSDHSSFYGKNIPVLFFSTGAHLDYHTPYDTPSKINYEGLRDISELVYDIAEEIACDTARLVFKESGPRVETSRGSRRKGVTFGIMPDFAGNVENGLRADFVTPGKPAALGGMEKGDIITAINGLPVNNIQDYMYRLSKLNFGETISVEILRGEKKKVLLISL